LKIWLLTVGEPLPIDPSQQRLLRSGILANTLADRGIDVVWWSSTLRHTEKDQRFDATTAVEVTSRLKIWCLHTPLYRRNISMARILSNRHVGAEFARHAPSEPPPDVIVASYPIPELAAAGAAYAQDRGIPTVVDIRDLWPDVWPSIVPAFAQPLARLALHPFYRQSRQVLRQFDSISGITDDIVDWGVARAGRARRPTDMAFPLAYPAIAYSESELHEARAFWSSRLGPGPRPDLRLCYIGNVASQRGRLDVMIEAMRRLPAAVRERVQLVVCGTGASLPKLTNAARDMPQVVFPGWINGPQIHALATSSDLGVLPYPSELDFERSIPNKVIEYLAYGLPILTSLRGPVSRLIESEMCGCIYRETDPEDMARVIARLVERPAQLRPLSVNAARVFRERFLASTVYGNYVDFLIGLADKRSGRELPLKRVVDVA
jgi:glycosyltransferase involved in cell wall biosynthesis